MVGHVKKPIDYTSDVLFDAIKQTELIQKLFLEIYHLVNMVNEIPRKYSHMPEFTHHDTLDTSMIIEAQNKLEENQKRREKEKRKKLKEMKKERELYMKGEIKEMKPIAKKPRNKWWPIDYGWEIDYYW